MSEKHTGVQLTSRDFPHAALRPEETVPRIRPETARLLIETVNDARYAGVVPSITIEPAIVIAVWTNSMVKYLIDEQQCEETIQNLRKAMRNKKDDSK